MSYLVTDFTRNMNLGFVILVILTLSLVTYGSNSGLASGLSCESTTIEKQFERAAFVFSGHLISKDHYDWTNPNYVKNTFLIDEIFKGNDTDEITIFDDEDDYWGFNFEEEINYIVFANRWQGDWDVDTWCGLSGHFNSEMASQIRELSESTVSAEPSQGWERLADMPEPRSEMESAVINQNIYVVGGLTNKNSISDSVFVFDTNNESWSTGTSMPLELHHSAAASNNGKLYVVGGYVEGWNPSSALLIYDSDTDLWSIGAEMPTPRGALTVQFVDGKLYAIGGFNEFTRTENEAYDPETDSWESKSPMPTPREHLASSVLDEKLYVIGGRASQSNSNANEVYDYTTNTWNTLEALPTARSGLTASTLSGAIFVFGGESSLYTFEENEAYIPGEGWLTQQPMPISRHGLASSAVGENIYLIGGGVSPGFSFSAITEKYHNTIIPEFGIISIVFAISVIAILFTKSKLKMTIQA